MILWRRKLVILASLLLCILAGAAYIAITPPRYLATTAMLIDPRLGKSMGNDPNAPGIITDNAAIDSQIKLFTSQTVLSRVAAQVSLASDPEFNGSQRSLLQRLLHPTQALEGGIDLKALEDAITIKRPERTYIVEIDVLARDPKKAAQIANGLTQAYIDDQVSSRIGAAKDDTQYVLQKLDVVSKQIRDLDDRIEEYKAKNKIIEATGLRFNEQQVTDLTKALGDARARESDAKAKFTEIDRLAREGRLDASSEALKSLTVERLRQQQAETEQNVARLGKTLGDRHPELMEAKERQSKVRSLIRAELQRLRTSAQGDYRSARLNERQIVAEVDQLKGQSNKLSHALVPLEQLERNRTVLRSSFDRFSQANSNLAQQEGASPPGRVIAVARPPVSPASPKKTVVGVAAISAGLFLGLASALFSEGMGPSRPLIPPIVYDTPAAQAATNGQAAAIGTTMTTMSGGLSRRDALRAAVLAGTAAVLPSPGRAAGGGSRESLAAAARAGGLVFGAATDEAFLNDDAFRDLFVAEAALLVPENALKFDALQPQQGVFAFAAGDALVDAARRHGLLARGHTLFWNDWPPRWLKSLSRREVERVFDNHLATVVPHFAGRLQSWDVVNEPFWLGKDKPGTFRPGPWFDAMGADYIFRAFRRTAELDPHAKLVLNEAWTERSDPVGLAVRRALLTLVDRIKDKGLRLDAVGLQGHLLPNVPYDDAGFADFLHKLAERKVEIYITEFDVDDEAYPDNDAARDRAVAQRAGAFLRAALAVPAVTTLITWGLSDRYTWWRDPNVMAAHGLDRLARPLPFDDMLQPKPMRTAMAEAFRARRVPPHG